MKEYDIEWLEVKTLKKGNLELGHIKKGRYLSPPDLAGVEFSQYIPKENIYVIYAESAEQAECYFSQFCQQECIKCMRVPEGTEKRLLTLCFIHRDRKWLWKLSGEMMEK